MRAWLAALDHRFDAAFGAAGNPLKQLGALAFLALWLLALTGVVLYALLDTSVQGAYASVEALSREPFSLGSALRGVHRYAADAFALAIVLHLVREWALGRYSRFRKYSWLTGVVLLPLAWGCAIGGFWLNWDRLAQFSAGAFAEWVDVLPVLSAPLSRNFLGGAVSDRLFSLFVFVHLGLPLLMVFGCWAHIQRIGHAAVFPQRALALGTSATLLALALAVPVHGQGPAELASMPAQLRLDWLLLFVHPLVDAIGPQAAWLALACVFSLLLALPWWRVPAAVPVAQVLPQHCNGCGRCVDDCPYAAITLVPHPDRRVGTQMAQVRAAACASCGICAAACPSSTPFRKVEDLHTGIDLPHWPIARVREDVRRALAQGTRTLVVGCECNGATDASVRLPCIGLLPPSFVEYALREGAQGVVVAGCREGECEYRLGPRWTRERLQGQREPHLRAGVTGWEMTE